MSAEAWTLTACSLVIVAAAVGAVYLRRAADRSWARYVALRSLSDNWCRFQIAIVDQLTPALDQMAKAIADMAPRFAELGEVFKTTEKGPR